MLAKANTIYISEPGQYHAFPRDRDLVLNDNIVAMVPVDDDIIVLTDGHPYVIEAGMLESGPRYTVRRHPRPVVCISKASIGVGTSGVIWASRDGLFLMGNTRYGMALQCLTEDLFHEDDWRALSPPTIRGVAYEGSYYFTGNGRVTDQVTGFQARTFALAFDDTAYESPENVRLRSLSIEPDQWFVTRKGLLYYAIGGELYRWDEHSGTASPYSYVTRVIAEHTNLNYAAAKVLSRGTGYLEFRLWKIVCGKKQLLFSRMLTHCRPFRLPRCIWGDDHFIELVGTKCVQEVHLATSEQDLTLAQSTSLPMGQDKRW